MNYTLVDCSFVRYWNQWPTGPTWIGPWVTQFATTGGITVIDPPRIKPVSK